MIVFRKVNVAKGLVVFIISLAVLVLVGGCRPTEPEFTEPPEVEVVEPDPADIEPDRVEPEIVEPVNTEPDDRQPRATVSFHDKCADTLKTFVDAQGMVDYKGLRRRRYELRTLLEDFSKLDRGQYKSWPKADKIAFWINMYNLQKLKVVVDNYPITP